MSWLATGRIGMGIKFDETPPELVERLAGDTASARAR
jgi:hypothetical protein